MSALALSDWWRALTGRPQLALVRPDPAPCVRGVDVSGWQDPIDWRRAYVEDGVRFCVVKASEGLGHVSPGWERHARQVADEVGRLSAYHFARLAKWRDGLEARRAGVDQAHACLSVCAGAGQPKLWAGPTLDLEWECEKTGNRPAPDHLYAFADVWLREVQAATGLAPGVYLAPSYWRWRWPKTAEAAQLLDVYQLWIPKYGSQPWPDPAKAPALGPHRPTIWQTTGKGSLPGRGDKGGTVRVDCNLFLGDETELDALGRAA